MKLENMSIVIEPIRYKLWQKRPFLQYEIEIIDKALKNQIPMQLEYHSDCITCSKCEAYIDSKDWKVCPMCETKIDWGKE